MKTIQIDSTGRSHEITKEHVAGKEKGYGNKDRFTSKQTIN